MSIPQGPQIHPYLTIVQRTPRTLQVGLLPQEAVMVEVPDEYRRKMCNGFLPAVTVPAICKSSFTSLVEDSTK